MTNIEVYRKKWHFNIGIFIFGVIFIYLAATVLLYLTGNHVSIYEVREGSIQKDTAYTGLILREETVVNDSAAQGGLIAAAAASEAAELGGKRKTLQDRIAATSEEVKGYFEEITAFLAQFSAVAVLRGKLYLTYRWKKRAVVKCTVHGKAVVLHLALDPAAFADTKYRMEDKSGVQSFANFPAEFKVKSERSLKYGKELISYILENLGAIQGDKNAAAVRKEIGS